MYNVAVILAGGVGNRLGSEIPKQLLQVCGKTIIEYSIEAFEKNEHIDEIVIVINSKYLDQIRSITSRKKYTKVSKIIAGGDSRSSSSLAAINAFKNMNNDNLNLLFHDSVRPLISQQIINEVANALERYNAVNVGVKTTDTIMKLDCDNFMQEVPARNLLYRTQTPQAFRYSTISKAYHLAMQDTDFKATDDCGVVLKYLSDEKIYVVNGEERNIKITYKADLDIMKLHLIK